MSPTSLVPFYVSAAFAISIGGFINGYDTGAIGAITSMPQFAHSIGALSSTLLGFTVSIIMLAGAIPSVFAGYIADRIGRLKVIAAGAALFTIGAVLQGTSATLAQFIAGRAICGLGEGVFFSNISVYVCEIAPTRVRGVLTGVPQFVCCAGVCAGYFTCYGSVGIDSSMAWRVPYIVQAVLGVSLAALCFVLPESPRWLVLHGQRDKAMKALERLGISLVNSDRDILLGESAESRTGLTLWQSVRLLFRRNYRSRTILGLFVLGMVQLSGIDAVLYYAPVLFRQAGISSGTATFLASGVSAILMLAITVPAFLLCDKWGRRTSAITGGVILSGLMLLIGSLYAAGAVHPFGVARWVVVTSVFAFGLGYCATWGIVGKVYASEIQPAHTRGAANCVAQGLGFFTNFLVAMLAPILLDKSAFGVYFLFGGLALFTVVVLALYMPETRGRSLEDIQIAFERPPTVLKSLSKLTAGLRKRSSRSAATFPDTVSGSVAAAVDSRHEDRSQSSPDGVELVSGVSSAAMSLRVDISTMG